MRPHTRPLPVPHCVNAVIVTACAVGHISASRGRSCLGCTGCPSLWMELPVGWSRSGGGLCFLWRCLHGGDRALGLQVLYKGCSSRMHLPGPATGCCWAPGQAEQDKPVVWLGGSTKPCTWDGWTSRDGSTHPASCSGDLTVKSAGLGSVTLELLRDSGP